MFWIVILALLAFFVGLPILVALLTSRGFWYFLGFTVCAVFVWLCLVLPR